MMGAHMTALATAIPATPPLVEMRDVSTWVATSR